MPREAHEKAFEAYGTALARGFHNANYMIADLAYLKRCMQEMDMGLSLADEIVRTLDDAAAALPLDAQEQVERERRIAALQSWIKPPAPLIFLAVSLCERLAKRPLPI